MADKIRTMARNSNCDLYADAHKNIAMVSGKDAYAQIINAKMRTALGEMQLNVNGGIPYFQTVFKDPSLQNVWESEVIKMLQGLSFVTEVKSLSCQVDNGVLYYEAEIVTDNGELKVNG